MKNILYLLAGTALGFVACSLSSKQISYKTMRTSTYPVDKLIISRSSAPAFSGIQIDHAQLMSLFEAARWAPSSYNEQPWRFIYATKNSPDWQKFFDTLVPFNQSWTANASALILVLSEKHSSRTGNRMRTHSYDTGSAVQNLLLQAHALGLGAHVMEGFDYDKIRSVLAIPDSMAVESMIAVGYPADIKKLPTEEQEREIPSTRKNLTEFVFQGSLNNPIK